MGSDVDDFGIDPQLWTSLTPAQWRVSTMGAPAPSAMPNLLPADAARKRFLNMSYSSLSQRAGVWRLWWRAKWAVRSLWIRYLRHRQRMSDLAKLATMDDLALRDIGISRMEIRAAMRQGTDLTRSR
jgi:uncharacterized protein YjiS (DUF1127 family)